MTSKFIRLFVFLVSLALPSASAFFHGSNSGPTGLALQGGFDLGTHSYAFANFMKLAGSMQSTTISNWPAYLDANGYPNNNGGVIPSSTNIFGQINLPTSYGNGLWDMEWTGTGAFHISAAVSNVTIISGSCSSGFYAFYLECTGTNVRVTFTFTSGTPSAPGWIFPPATYSGMSNLILCRASDPYAGDRAAILANPNAFNSDFISLITALKPKTIRALDWSGANSGNQTHLSQRFPLTAFAYLNSRWAPELWAGTAAGTDTYTSSAPSTWPGLVQGAVVQVVFTNANTVTTPTLNVAGTGAITIVDRTTNPPSVGGISANSVATLSYDAVLNQWIWTNQTGFLPQIPIELHIALANAINANLWLNIPGFYDAATDGPSIVSIVQSSLKSGLIFYPELSNEIWNSAGGFTQTSYAQGEGAALFPAAGVARQIAGWYALRTRQMMGAITTAWGGPSTNLKRVIAAQATSDAGLSGTNNLYRFQGGDLASFSFNAFPNRPIDLADTVAYATYYAGVQFASVSGNYTLPLNVGGPNSVGVFTGLLGAADDYASGVPAQMTNALAYVDWDIRTGIQPTLGITSISNATPSVVTTTASHGLVAGRIVAFNTTGTLPTGITKGQNYFVIATGLTSTQFQFSATLGGAAIATSSAGSGTHTYGVAGMFDSLLYLSTYGNGPGIYPQWETLVTSYDGVGTNRPTGTQNLTVENYEGGLEATPPLAAQCTALSLAAKYCDPGGEIDVLLTAYKNNILLAQLVQDQYTQFCGGTLCGVGGSTLPHSKTPAWYNFQGPTQWSLQPGDIYSTPYQSYNGTAAFNHL